MQAAVARRGPGRSRRKPSLRCGLGMEPRGITASDHLRRFEVLEWQQHRKVPRLRPRALGEEEKRASQPFANPASGWPYQSPAWSVLVFVENQGMTLICLQSPPDCSLITPTERRRHPQRGSRGRMPRPTAWLAQHLAALSGFEESIQGPRQL